MTPEEYEDFLPTFVEELTAAFLEAEEKHPGGMKAWMESLSTGKGRQVEDGQAIPYEQHGLHPNSYRGETGLCMCYSCLDLRRAYWSENQ